jgi:hypothetical protein
MALKESWGTLVKEKWGVLVRLSLPKFIINKKVCSFEVFHVDD